MKKYLQKVDILGLVLLIAAVIWYSISNVWGKANLGLAIAGGALILVGLATGYRQILSSLGKRSTKYAGNYALSIILVIAVAGGLNYVGQRHVKRFDTTGNGRFSLAPQTTQLLKNLEKDVEIKAFFPGGNHEPLEDMLKAYRGVGDHFRYEFIDPNRQNDLANQYDVSVYGIFENPMTGATLKFGTVVVSYGGRREKIEKRSEEVAEEDLTNAIIKVGRTETKKIYFVQGHGEKDPESSEQAGYSLAKKALETQSYVVESVNLAERGAVPENAQVLIIAGMKTEPFPMELEFIKTFLDAGGGVLFMMDPTPSPSLQSFFNEWGVQIDNDVILDDNILGQLIGTSKSTPLVSGYESHSITDRFDRMTFFPMTRSIRRMNSGPDDVIVQTLFNSSSESWGETNLNNPKPVYNPGQDLEGPLSLAVAVTKEVREASEEQSAVNARMVVTGTSRFATDAYFAQGNGNMFLNMVNWLAQDEDLIAIRPKPVDDRPVPLSQGQLMLIRFVTVFMLPGLALIIGIVVVMRRRRL